MGVAIILEYRWCDCYIWIISTLDPVGHCKFCGEKPERPGTREEYKQRHKLETWRKIHGDVHDRAV